jgi:hypothetical protein
MGTLSTNNFSWRMSPLSVGQNNLTITLRKLFLRNKFFWLLLLFYRGVRPHLLLHCTAPGTFPHFLLSITLDIHQSSSLYNPIVVAMSSSPGSFSICHWLVLTTWMENILWWWLGRISCGVLVLPSYFWTVWTIWWWTTQWCRWPMTVDLWFRICRRRWWWWWWCWYWPRWSFL